MSQKFRTWWDWLVSAPQCLGPQLKDEKAGGLKSPAGLTEPGGSVSQMAHTHGRQVGAGCWHRSQSLSAWASLQDAWIALWYAAGFPRKGGSKGEQGRSIMSFITSSEVMHYHFTTLYLLEVSPSAKHTFKGRGMRFYSLGGGSIIEYGDIF